VARLSRVLSGQGVTDHPTDPSIAPPETDAIDSFATIRDCGAVSGGESANALAVGFDVDRRPVTNIIRSAGGAVRYRVITAADANVAWALHEKGQSLTDAARIGPTPNRSVSDVADARTASRIRARGHTRGH